MKKKIGELTLNEAFEIKQACSEMENCKECAIKNPACFIICGALEVNAVDKDILDQEIEVEEC